MERVPVGKNKKTMMWAEGELCKMAAVSRHTVELAAISNISQKCLAECFEMGVRNTKESRQQRDVIWDSFCELR
jgi:hypothetical protein